MLFYLFVELFFAVKFVLEFGVALMVDFLEVVLKELEGVDYGVGGVVIAEDLLEFLFVVCRDTRVEDGEDGSFFGIFASVYLQIKRLLFEVKVEIDFFLEQKWSHFDCEMQEFSFNGYKVISVFSNDLEVLLLDWIFESVDNI